LVQHDSPSQEKRHIQVKIAGRLSVFQERIMIRLRPYKFASKASLEILVHVFGWLLMLISPLLSMEGSTAPFQDYFEQVKFPLLFAFVFYTNYLFLIHNLFFRKKFFAFVISNLILYAGCIFVLEASRPAVPRWPRFFRQQEMRQNIPPQEQAKMIRLRPSPGGMYLRFLISFGLTTGLSVAVQVTKQWFRSESMRTDLEREHLKSELANLKNQLNPHFFFNTLNNIYSLIAQNQDKAQSAVLQLSKLMRYLLYESNEQFVPLSKEVQFMHHYIDLMKLRVSGNVSVRYELPKDTGTHRIAPLLFISLIENSFKHGVSMNRPSEIEMSLVVEPARKVVFTIRNTSFPKDDKDRSGSGIGLENLRKRLALLYPDKHTLDIQSDSSYYTTVLTLQL
jgi:hypothetical protein